MKIYLCLILFVFYLSSYILTTTSQSQLKCYSNCPSPNYEVCKIFCDQESTIKSDINSIFLMNDDNDNISKMSQPLSSKLIWESYQTQLFSFIKRGSSKKGLQLLRNPIKAIWDLKPSQLTEIGNTISQYGVEYKVKDKTQKFNEIYYSFLKNIKISTDKISPNLKNELIEKRKELNEAEEKYEKNLKKCQEKYEKRLSFQKDLSFEQFAQQRCFMLSFLKDKVLTCRIHLSQLERQIGGKFAPVLTAIHKYEGSESYDWNESYINNLKSFRKKIEKDEPLNGFSLMVTKASTLNIDKNKEWKWIDIEKEDKKNSSSISFIKEKSGKERKLTTSSDHFKIIIAADGYISVDISPSENWFLSSILNNFKNGPFKKNIQYFGSKGILSLMKSKLHIVYKPKISLFLNEKDTKLFKSMKKDIKIGPFDVNTETIIVEPTASSSSSSTTTTTTTTNENDEPIVKEEKEEKKEKIFKVTFVSEESNPLVVAIDNIVL